MLKTLKQRLAEQRRQREGRTGSALRVEGDDVAAVQAWLLDRADVVIELRAAPSDVPGGCAVAAVYSERGGLGVPAAKLGNSLWDALLEAVAAYEDKYDPEPSFHGSGSVD